MTAVYNYYDAILQSLLILNLKRMLNPHQNRRNDITGKNWLQRARRRGWLTDVRFAWAACSFDAIKTCTNCYPAKPVTLILVPAWLKVTSITFPLSLHIHAMMIIQHRAGRFAQLMMKGHVIWVMLLSDVCLLFLIVAPLVWMVQDCFWCLKR